MDGGFTIKMRSEDGDGERHGVCSFRTVDGERSTEVAAAAVAPSVKPKKLDN